MGQVLHASATTTEATRRAIQNSQESLRTLAKRYGINIKTVAKWKKRTSVADLPTGPKQPRSTVLSIEEEAAIVAFRKHTLLPLDDCLYALQPTIPHLTRSSLHRCLQRHGISRLPEPEGEKPVKKTFKRYPIGYFHIDIAEVHTAEGKLYLFLAIDRTSKFAFAELHGRATKMAAAQFLRNLINAVPYHIHTVLTDNGIQFTNRRRDRYGPAHIFTRVCQEHGIEHRLTQVKHPWTNGQVERMNRTIKEATVKRFHYDDHAQLQQHLASFMNAYNFARRLKTLKGLTPYEFICKQWNDQPERFRINPCQLMAGLNIYLVSIIPHGEELSEITIAFSLIELMGIFGLIFVWITQTRINTANYFVATTNMQAFFKDTLRLNWSKMVWAIVVGVVVFLLMLVDVFAYLLQALAYQGIFVVAWVAIALTHILHPRRIQIFGEVPQIRSAKLPAFERSGLVAWFGATIVGVILMNIGGVWTNWYATVTFFTAAILYALLMPKHKQNVIAD